MNNFAEIIKRPIAYHVILAKVFKSVKLAVLWSQIYYWSERTEDPQGWVYKTIEQMYDETGLVRKEQETARAIGQRLGILFSERRGPLGKLHYRVNLATTGALVDDWISKNGIKKPKFITNKIEPGFGKNGELKELSIVKEKSGNLDLPDWVDMVAWLDWEKYRKERKIKLTAMSIKQQLKLLESFKERQAEIIYTSIRNGWRGLFEPKGKKIPENSLSAKPGKYAFLK